MTFRIIGDGPRPGLELHEVRLSGGCARNPDEWAVPARQGFS